MKEFLFVAGWTLLAGASATGAVTLFNRWFGAPPKPGAREPQDKEPASPVPATPGRRRLRLPTPRPGDTAHEGATEGFGAQLAAMKTSTRSRLQPPLDAAERVMFDAVSRYEAMAGAAYESAAANIGNALEAFLRSSGLPMPHVAPQPSIEVALIRLRGGVLEPAGAYRPAVTDTGSFDRAELEALLAADGRELVPA